MRLWTSYSRDLLKRSSQTSRPKSTAKKIGQKRRGARRGDFLGRGKFKKPVGSTRVGRPFLLGIMAVWTPATTAGATSSEGLSTSSTEAWIAYLRDCTDSGAARLALTRAAAHVTQARLRRMSSAMETDPSRDRTRGRGEAEDDQDGVPEHLKCVVCFGEGGTALIQQRA